jgi:antitoxin MazE
MVIKMTRRGTITLPKDMRRNLDDEMLFEVVRREDGVIELHPRITIDPSQAWFWTERWQKMEREVEEEYARGDYKQFDSGEEFMAELEEIDKKLRAEGR